MPYTLSPYEKTSVLYDYKTIDTTKDFIVSLEYSCYGGTLSGAEGFSLFLVDCRELHPDGRDGGPGPALGVTSLFAFTGFPYFDFKFFPGVRGTVFAIGFDITGNFGSDQNGLDGFATPASNTISLRGREEDDFNILYRTENLASTSYSEPFYIYRHSLTGVPNFRTFRLRGTKFGRNIILDHRIGEKFYNIFEYRLPYDLPPTVYPCIGYSTNEANTMLALKNVNENGFFVTPTVTPSWTPTPTMTPSKTPTNTPTPSKTPTNTPTPTKTPTNTPTPTETPTNTPSPTITSTNTQTPTNTPTRTPTRTPTPTNTPTNTRTPSNTPTNTQTPSITPTNTQTPSNTPTNTQTPTNTRTPNVTPSNTPTNTQTPSITPTSSTTPSITPTNTQTPSNTPSNTQTPSITPTNTPTPSISPSNTPTPSITPTITPTNVFEEFNFASSVTINDNSTATPYPVTCNVTGLGSNVSKIAIQLENYNHNFPADCAILLVSPLGTPVLLSGRIGETSAINVNVLLDQSAPTQWNGFSSGTFRPAYVDNNPTFNSPAPAGPYSADLSVYNNTNANGTWSIYIQDYALFDAGSIGNIKLLAYY